MKKNYSYIINGKNGKGHTFQMVGKITCDYADIWDEANQDCLAQLKKYKRLICPISIEDVMIQVIQVPKYND